jgi:hypothetical protein
MARLDDVRANGIKGSTGPRSPRGARSPRNGDAGSMKKMGKSREDKVEEPAFSGFWHEELPAEKSKFDKMIDTWIEAGNRWNADKLKDKDGRQLPAPPSHPNRVRVDRASLNPERWPLGTGGGAGSDRCRTTSMPSNGSSRRGKAMLMNLPSSGNCSKRRPAVPVNAFECTARVRYG